MSILSTLQPTHHPTTLSAQLNKMHLPSFLLTSLLPLLALAQGGDPNAPGYYNTVAEIYAGPDCTEDSFVWADPIFGRGGQCQLLDRNNNTPDILSYKIVSQHPECVGEFSFTIEIS